jgi:hypothetical protein
MRQACAISMRVALGRDGGVSKWAAVVDQLRRGLPIASVVVFGEFMLDEH